MDTAWPDDDEEPLLRVCVVDDSGGLVAAGDDGSFAAGGLREFVLEEVGGYEWVVAFYAPVLAVVAVADGFVFDEVGWLLRTMR